MSPRAATMPAVTPLRLLRVLYQQESHIPRLTSSVPPLLRIVEQSRSGAWDVREEMEPADANGENLSAALVTLIGGITATHDPTHCQDCQRNPLLNEQTTAYSNRHPLRQALTQLERRCRREHRPPAWHDHPTPICAILLHLVIVDGLRVAEAAEAVGVSHGRAVRLLYNAGRDVLAALRREEDRLLGIKDTTHRLRDCPNPKGCPICSETFSPSDEARTGYVANPERGSEKHTRGGDDAEAVRQAYDG